MSVRWKITCLHLTNWQSYSIFVCGCAPVYVVVVGIVLRLLLLPSHFLVHLREILGNFFWRYFPSVYCSVLQFPHFLVHCVEMREKCGLIKSQSIQCLRHSTVCKLIIESIFSAGKLCHPLHCKHTFRRERNRDQEKNWNDDCQNELNSSKPSKYGWYGARRQWANIHNRKSNRSIYCSEFYIFVFGSALTVSSEPVCYLRFAALYSIAVDNFTIGWHSCEYYAVVVCAVLW